jgi:hypothetical protein
MTQAIEHLPHKCKAVSSNLSTAKKKKKDYITNVFQMYFLVVLQYKRFLL